MAQLKQKAKNLEAELKAKKKDLQKMNKKITEMEDEIIEEKGPFELQLDDVLNSMKLA